MTTRATPYVRRRSGDRGVTLIELVVAVGVFALFIVLIDAVFIGTNRSSRKAELAVDVQQNARIAAERLSREIRETRASEVAVGGTPGQRAVVFKSARLKQDQTKFCLYVRATNDPLYVVQCFDTVGVPKPPYVTDPPYAAPCNTANGGPCMTYTPIWQRWIAYYTVDPDANGLPPYELWRQEGDLTAPGDALPDPTILTGGNAVATHVESFDVDLATDRVTVRLKAKGTEIVQGSDLPVQEMFLPGQVQVRN